MGNEFRVFKNRYKLNSRKNFFNKRIVNVWKKLSSVFVCSSNINAFNKI